GRVGRRMLGLRDGSSVVCASDLVQAGGGAVLERIAGRVADAEAGRGRVGGRAGRAGRVQGVDQGAGVGRERRRLVVAGLVERAGVEVVGAVDGAGEGEAAGGGGGEDARVLQVGADRGFRPVLDLVQAGVAVVLEATAGR